METSAISYRVADFLKQHPPFNGIAESDLVSLAANGRVRFHEAQEFILWQGEPHKAHVFVIQQGTVSVWDERSGDSELRDVRGAGDLLGAERFHGERSVLFSARAASDVILYGFAAEDFAYLLEKYPYAQRFVDALGSVISDLQRDDEQPDPQRIFLHTVASRPPVCEPTQSLADAARTLALSGAEAIAVTGAASQILGLVSPRTLLGWMVDGGVSVEQPLGEMPLEVPPTLGPDASIADGVIAMGTSTANALTITSDGSATGRVLSVITRRDLAVVFGDNPAAILQDIRRAVDFDSLRSLNGRARACALRYLTSAPSSEWISRFIESVDLAILTRLIALTAGDDGRDCWCVCGASGRGESIAARQPHLVLIHDDQAGESRALERYARARDGLSQCGYVAGAEPQSDVASVQEWSRRYAAWIQNPVIEGMARSRALFDLRPFFGARDLWNGVQQGVARTIDRDIVRVLAHDCLASLPPLTFYEDAVINQAGEQTTVFRLEHSVLGPLVDLGRVFGMAARDVMGTSTLQRFALARRLLPAQEAIFRNAADTLRIVLWQQGRVGITQGTAGTELPPALLSRNDRHLLKSGFPVIRRLLELTADSAWVEAM